MHISLVWQTKEYDQASDVEPKLIDQNRTKRGPSMIAFGPGANPTVASYNAKGGLARFES
jgi:hypothetical protein